MTNPLLELRGAAVHYGRGERRVRALDGVDLAVRPGERVGIVGGSGSGKTTIARLLLGLVRPTSGEVWFRGQRVDTHPERELAALRSTVSMVFQDPNSSLDPRMRLRDIITEPLRSPWLTRSGAVPAPSPATVTESLREVGLDPALADRFPHQLSGGQRQRVAIARALVSEPGVLVADEPVSALDVSVRAQVLNLLADEVRRRELALVFVSHDLAVVRHLCERVVVVHRGRIVEHGPVARVLSEPHHPYTRALLAAVLAV